jgi:flagellar biosynthetic protein FlhB
VAGDASQKTEKPTPKRLREAREKGQIARSPELTAWSAMLVTTVLLQMTVSRGAETFPAILRDMGEAIAAADVNVAMQFAGESMWKAVGVVAPLLIGLTLVTIVVGLGQVGLKPSLKRLKQDFSRLNVLKGLKRLVSAPSWWEVGKALVKIALLALVAWPAMAHVLDVFRSGGALDTLAAQTAATAITVIRNISIAGLAVAAFDYLWQRRRLMRDLRMTRQELREELRQQEASPEMRRAIRSRQMAVSRNRMIRMVSGADVVVVNPTHYAVALRYEASKGAPEVVAKGAGALAARIRAEAAAHDVPVVHEPVLTRALYRACDVGALIPLELYEAVAHVLAFVFGLRAKGRAHGYHELPRPALAGA